MKRKSPRRCSEEVTRTRPWTTSQEQTKTRSTQDCLIRGKTRRSGRNKTTTKCGGRSPDAPDWNIPGGTSSRGRPLQDWSIRGRVAARRPGRAHPGRIKEQGLPPDWIIRGQTADERHSSIIRGGTSSTSHRTPDWIIRGQRAARRPRLEYPGWNRQQEPPHSRHDSRGTHGGQTPRTGASGPEQEGAATTTGAGERWFAAPGRNARGG